MGNHVPSPGYHRLLSLFHRLNSHVLPNSLYTCWLQGRSSPLKITWDPVSDQSIYRHTQYLLHCNWSLLRYAPLPGNQRGVSQRRHCNSRPVSHLPEVQGCLHHFQSGLWSSFLLPLALLEQRLQEKREVHLRLIPLQRSSPNRFDDQPGVFVNVGARCNASLVWYLQISCD